MAADPFSEDELLDYVRGVAPPALSGRIEAMMAHDRALEAEIALMRGLKPALDGVDSSQPPGAFGWKRLEAAIGRDAAQRRPAPSPRHGPALRIAAAVLGVAVLGQAAYIASLSTTADEAAYHTASDPAEAHVLGVGFADGATVAEIGALLRSADARIIDGPSALGLYRVAFPSADALREGQARFGASALIDLVAEE